MAAILYFRKTLKKITCTSPYRGECDCNICKKYDFKFLSFCDLKKIVIDPWRPF